MPASLPEKQFDRPVTQTTQEAITPNAEIFAVGNGFVVDIYTTVSGNSKVLARVKIPSEFKGYEWRTGAQFLLFPGSATNYSNNGTTPVDAAALKTSQVIYSEYLNLNTFYAAAGDAS